MSLVLECSRLSPHQTYLLALSGGRDSVCLLHQLLDHGFHKIHLVHLNHQLRGTESDADARFVQKLAIDHNLPLTLASAPVAKQAEENSQSLETAAREARHRLFAETSQLTGCQQILLAHHAEDQAETCLFNLLRGSSGIKGMSAETEFLIGQEKLIFLRPLLQARRTEIDHYLRERKITFREDASNQDPAHTRNRLRNEALPLLADILRRDIVPTLLRTEAINRENEKIILTLLASLQLRDPQGRLFLPKLRALDPALQRACLKQFLSEHKVQRISNVLLDEAIQLIPPEGPPKMNLPGNRFLQRKQARIFLT